jgi:hypothetical protein
MVDSAPATGTSTEAEAATEGDGEAATEGDGEAAGKGQAEDESGAASMPTGPTRKKTDAVP